LISRKLAARMAVHSEGLLRRINILADKMLLSAFADGTHTLTAKHLQDAVKDSGFAPLHKRKSNWRWWLVGSFGVLVVLALAYAVLNNPYYSRKLASSPSPAPQPLAEDRASQPAPAANVEQADTGARDLAAPAVGAVERPGGMAAQDTADTQPVEPLARATKIVMSAEKIQQSGAIIDKVTSNQTVEELSSSDQSDDYLAWLENKIEASKQWLRGADKQGVSIQVMMRSKSAGRELAAYLQSEWPLDLDKTYLYEVKMKDQTIYRVFYNEYPTISLGQMKMKQLPESVRLNSPYLHSIYRMQKALL
jgi:hypothetical protein